MVKRDVIAEKMANAVRRLDAAERIFSHPLEELMKDEEKRDLATFYTFIVVQECIDIAAHWVADAGWRSPSEAGGMFDVLCENGQITADMAKGLRQAVGLRNRVAHNYGSLEPERLHDEFAPGARTLRAFLAIAAEKVGL